MSRPGVRREPPDLDTSVKYLILDGYIDEPASLGVPPYIAPQVRSLAGGLVTGGTERDRIGYLTVDQWRSIKGSPGGIGSLRHLETVIIVTGCIVPGKYLRGTPISRREVIEVAEEVREAGIVVAGPAAGKVADIEGLHICKGDLGVLGEGISSTGRLVDRDRSPEEWNEHLLRGAFMIWMHPDHPSPLIAEIETSRGCPRYISGGCSFCSEPGKGPVQFREPDSIKDEVHELSSFGLENIRIGGQSDILTYMSADVGKTDVPVPDPSSLENMLSGVREELHHGKGVKRALSHGRRCGIDTGIIHTDNANPAVAFEHREETRKALDVIVRYSTSGNVLALGLESSDVDVRRINNLNAGPGETMEAVRMINEAGRQRGANGLPVHLPGINFLGGLPGQTPESFQSDIELLRSILENGLLLRRINIRGAVYPDREGNPSTPHLKGKVSKAFHAFRDQVRSQFDPVFLKNVIGEGSVLKGVHMETASGHVRFGRQIGSYPVLVGVEHDAGMGTFIDVVVTEFSSRSVTGFQTPFNINGMGFRDLQALPGVGKRRAAELFNSMPLDQAGIDEIMGERPWFSEHLVLDP
ncbi:MAG: radical SAM protein [Thermoplasmatota archaeon]